MLAGLILDTERRGLTGIPGLASIPFIGRLFARNKDEAQQTDIVMTLTPHVIRKTEITEADLRSFLVGGEVSPFQFETPPAGAVGPARRSGRPSPGSSRSARPRRRRTRIPRIPERPRRGRTGSPGQALTGAASFSILTLLMRLRSTSTTVKRQSLTVVTTSPPLGTEPSCSSMKPATVSNSADSGSGIS